MFLAILLGVARYEARYSTELALRDLARLRVPGEYLASGIDQAHLAPAVASFLESAVPSSDPSQALAVIEMHAAGIFTPSPDPVEVSVQFQDLLKAYPDSPVVHARYGAYLLTRLQQIALKRSNHRLELSRTPGGALSQAEDLAYEARREFERVIRIDPSNSLSYYEIAYSYLLFSEKRKAVDWLYKGMSAPEFDASDHVVITGAARVVTGARIPPLEGALAAYKLACFQPSYMAGRMEELAAELLSDKATRDLRLRGQAYGNHLAAFEDMGEKLFQTADVLAQTQGSFFTSGILWRRMIREASAAHDAALKEIARRKLVEVSYRYLLVGWQRADAGLMPQQDVLELDTPADLRLNFSEAAQILRSLLATAIVVFLLPALVAGIVAVRVEAARQLAAALFVLVAFAALGYSASFCATISERASMWRALDARLRVTCQAPEFVRENGQPASPAQFRADVARNMLFTFGYSLQSARVLAYVGTRDCYDTLINSLTSRQMMCPREVISALEEATGARFGTWRSPDGSVSQAGIDEAVRGWQKWWRDNRQSFPEAPAEAVSSTGRSGARSALVLQRRGEYWAAAVAPDLAAR